MQHSQTHKLTRFSSYITFKCYYIRQILCKHSFLECFRVGTSKHLLFCPHFSMLHHFQFSLCPITVPPVGQFLSVGSLSWTGLHENNCQYVNTKHSEPLWTHSGIYKFVIAVLSTSKIHLNTAVTCL